MPAVTLPAGSRGFDSLGDPAPPAELAATGWLYRTFYIAQSSSYSTKITDARRAAGRDRVQAHLEAGVAVLLNYESSAERPLKGGHQGAVDGAWSAEIAEYLGCPVSVPLLPAVDIDARVPGTNPQRPVRDEVEDYVREYARACAPYPIGIYGGTPILDACADINRLGWQALASSWSTGIWPAARVHIKQRRPSSGETDAQPWANKFLIDANDALRPFTAWSHQAADVDPVAPQPLQEEYGMYRLNYNGMVLEVSGHAIRRVVSGLVSGVGPAAVAVGRDAVLHHVDELHTAGPSPFAGVAGYEDAELDAAWKSRPSIDAPASAGRVSGGTVTWPAGSGTITFG